MTTKICRNHLGDWTIKTINYPDGWRALVTLTTPSNFTNQLFKLANAGLRDLELTQEFLVDGFEDEDDAIDAAKYEIDQILINY